GSFTRFCTMTAAALVPASCRRYLSDPMNDSSLGAASWSIARPVMGWSACGAAGAGTFNSVAISRRVMGMGLVMGKEAQKLRGRGFGGAIAALILGIQQRDHVLADIDGVAGIKDVAGA